MVATLTEIVVPPEGISAALPGTHYVYTEINKEAEAKKEEDKPVV